MNTIWDRTAEFLSDNLAALTPIVLLAIFMPLTLLGTLKPLIGTMDMAGNLTLGVVTVLLAILTTWGGIAITALVFDPGAGRGPALSTANRRIVPVIGIGLATLLIVLVVAFPIGVALGLSGVDMTALAAGKAPSAGSVNGGAVAFATLYALALFAVLVWAYTRFFVLVTPIMVMERRGLGVYGRSFVLTRTIAWKVLGMLILYFVVSSVAGLAAKTVFGTIFALLIPGDGSISLAGVLTQIIVSAISTIFSVIAVTFVAKLYLASRDAREAIVEAA